MSITLKSLNELGTKARIECVLVDTEVKHSDKVCVCVCVCVCSVHVCVYMYVCVCAHARVCVSVRWISPSVEFRVEGLQWLVQYYLLLHVRPVDGFCYHFSNHRWAAAEDELDQVDLKREWQLYKHPASPMTGKSWMTSPVNFSAVKIAEYYDSNSSDNVS